MPDLKGVVRKAAGGLVDFALPPRCPGCGEIVEAVHLFCFPCWSRLHFLGEPCCETCGLPFDHETPEARCGACLADPPPFDRLRAAVAYGDLSARVALRLKYGGRLGVAETLARAMARHLRVEPDSWLAPVPLHRWRIWGRGYNQAALIAAALGRRCEAEVRPALLVRTRATPPLRGMNPRQRRRAVQGVFRIDPAQAVDLQGRPVVLVDDVFTTGATASACARTLKAAGARRVDILCWARVLREGAPETVGR